MKLLNMMIDSLLFRHPYDKVVIFVEVQMNIHKWQKCFVGKAFIIHLLYTKRNELPRETVFFCKYKTLLHSITTADSKGSMFLIAIKTFIFAIKLSRSLFTELQELHNYQLPCNFRFHF